MSKIPRFKSDKEAVEFWKKHEISNFEEELNEVELFWSPVEDTCKHCGSRTRPRFVNLDLFDNTITVHRVKEYYCPICNFVELSSEAKRKIQKIEQEVKNKGLIRYLIPKIA